MKHKKDPVYGKGLTSWNKGLTKETDTRVARMANSVSKTLKGRTPWNKGLSKATDNRLVEAGKKLSIVNTGKKRPTETIELDRKRAKKRWLNPEYREKQMLAAHTDTYRENQGKHSKSLWNDPVWAKKQATRILEGSQKAHPNNIEGQIISILKSLSSGIKYTGDGKYWISGMNPDFINKDKKQIIEVFGCYWHYCKKHLPNIKDRNLIIKKRQEDRRRIDMFKKLGYSILVIWEHEMIHPKQVLKKIQKFEAIRCV